MLCFVGIVQVASGDITYLIESSCDFMSRSNLMHITTLPQYGIPLLMSNQLASTIDAEVTTWSYWGYVVWDFNPGRSYQGEQARYRQLMTETRPTLAGYGEVFVLQQVGCGLCSRWILSLRSMVYTTRYWADELRTSQRPRSTSSVSELLQPSLVLASTVGTSYWKTIGNPPDPVR